MDVWYPMKSKRRATGMNCHICPAWLQIKPGRYGSRSLKEIALVCLNFLWEKELESHARNEDVAVKNKTKRNKNKKTKKSQKTFVK